MCGDLRAGGAADAPGLLEHARAAGSLARRSPARRRSCCARRTCRRSSASAASWYTLRLCDCDARLRRKVEREQVIPVAARDQQFRAAVDLAAVVGAGQALGAAIADQQPAEARLADAEGAHVDQVRLQHDAQRSRAVPSSMASSSSSSCRRSRTTPGRGRPTPSGRLRRTAPDSSSRSPGAQRVGTGEGREPRQHHVCHPLAEFRLPAIRRRRIRMRQAVGDGLGGNERLRHHAAEQVSGAANADPLGLAARPACRWARRRAAAA